MARTRPWACVVKCAKDHEHVCVLCMQLNMKTILSVLCIWELIIDDFAYDLWFFCKLKTFKDSLLYILSVTYHDVANNNNWVDLC